MICGELASRCSVTMAETAWCVIVWWFKWIVIPTTAILILWIIYKLKWTIIPQAIRKPKKEKNK